VDARPAGKLLLEARNQPTDLQNLNLPATCSQSSLAILELPGDHFMTILYSERHRVLLIDENSRRLNLLASILRNHEVEVHFATRLDEARSLWKNIPYDLVLLAAPENSGEAALALLQIRKSKPRQRIALLVGPPTYIREIGRPATKINSGPPSIADQSLLKPQWPEIVQNVVSNWYVDQGARFALDKVGTPLLGDPPFLAD
jgi:CheY-like chemotaxis protein